MERQALQGIRAAGWAVAASVALFFGGQNPARAYEEDTHFMMTYVLCRATGFTDAEALVVARHDQGMDDSDGTVANGGLGGVIPNVPEESLWHAIPRDGKNTTVLERKRHLWSKVLATQDPDIRLKLLGVFFHYQQDTWAHRHHMNSDPQNFEPYSTPIGHAMHMHQPDRPPFDPVCALRCLEEGIGYASQYLQQCLHRQPTALLAGYTPAHGAIDENWRDGRNGKYFHEILPDTSTPAHRFTTMLIRAQVDAYKSSLDATPAFAGRYTADEVKYDKVHDYVQGVCSAAGTGVTIPRSRTKLTDLTTSTIRGWLGE